MGIHQVVIIGAGFGGLYAAKELANKNVSVTVIDKRNFHLFQPLLYQVATGGLSPGDISSPIRAVLKKAKNVTVLCGSVDKIDPKNNSIEVNDKVITYDTLVLATGVKHHYFGNEQWNEMAPGLKSIEDALKMRMRIMKAFEEAEFENDEKIRKEWLKFVIVGGGPTGVELAGALGELSRQTLKKDFRNFNPAETEIYLIEGTNRILPTFPEKLSTKAIKSLQKLGIIIKANTMVTDLGSEGVILKVEDKTYEIRAKTILWAAGVKASSIGSILQKATNVELDRSGRVIVNPDLTVSDYQNIMVIGDLAHFKINDNKSLPGVAQVAMQQGRYAARSVLTKLRNKSPKPFSYRDKGNLAVIGRKAAIADIGFLKMSGWPAWLIWVFIHIAYLIEYDNKLKVLLQWAWDFFTRKRGARLITKME